MNQTQTRKIFAIILLTIAAISLSGCANVRVTHPANTATEQFLISQAAVEAVESMTFEPLYGRKVFIDNNYFAPAAREFVLAEFRAKLLNSGVLLVPSKEQAEIIMEVRSGGVGIDHYENLVGIPSLMAPSSMTSVASEVPMASIITPELALSKTIREVGYASVAYVAYWANDGQVVASGGPSLGKTFRQDYWFLGIGPSTTGTIVTVDREVE